MVGCLHYLWACSEAAHHGGELCGKAKLLISCPPGNKDRERKKERRRSWGLHISFKGMLPMT
jgi:hypothetical protein